jgi:hypothetical protein
MPRCPSSPHCFPTRDEPRRQPTLAFFPEKAGCEQYCRRLGCTMPTFGLSIRDYNGTTMRTQVAWRCTTTMKLRCPLER